IADEASAEILETVHLPVLRELARRGTPFQGLLYAGLMQTEDGLRVIEFNCRFGDPETQSLLPRLANDLLPRLAGDLSQQLETADRAAVTVVVSGGEYPERGDQGTPIEGIEAAEATGAVGPPNAGRRRRVRTGRPRTGAARGHLRRRALGRPTRRGGGADRPAGDRRPASLEPQRARRPRRAAGDRADAAGRSRCDGRRRQRAQRRRARAPDPERVRRAPARKPARRSLTDDVSAAGGQRNMADALSAERVREGVVRRERPEPAVAARGSLRHDAGEAD